MYNKPITQRVAYARSKKASALKQMVDTTVLKEEKIPVITDKSIKQLPDTTETITKPGELTGTIAKPGGKQMPNDKWLDFCDKNPCNAACHKQFGKCPDEEETITKKGGTEEVETPRYQYDYGDSMPSYMQRKVYRGLKVGERQTKKALKAQLKAGTITKDEYKAGLAKAATQRASASKAFAETQAEAARQGQTFGKKGTTKIGTFDPNVRISGEEGAVGRQTTAPDLGDAEEKLVNEKKRQDQLKAIENAKNQQKVDDINAQKEAGKKVVDAAPKMKAGPLKMKSSFKMGGFGSKTYKK